MVEMARQPPNLNNFMNKGIAFVIDRFRHRIPNCPIGQRPLMIGGRNPSYNTMDQVMGQVDRVMKVMEAMGHIVVVNVHEIFLLNLLHVYNSLLFCL